jgi:hypothetical protein
MLETTGKTRISLLLGVVLGFSACGPQPDQEQAQALGQATQAVTGTYTITLDKSVYFPRDKIKVTWSAPADHLTSDWIGLYKQNALNKDYIPGWWKWVPAGPTGTMEFASFTTPGMYDARYLLEGGYNAAAVTSFRVTVPGMCRDLGPADTYWYPNWTRCCDNAMTDPTQSTWTRYDGFIRVEQNSCYSFGLEP